MTTNPGLSGRVAAGRRGRGAAGPEVDGPVPGRPDRRARRPGRRADLRRVRPGRGRHASPAAPCGRTAPTGSGPSSSGASGAWTSRHRRRSGSSWRYVKANAVPRRNSRGGTRAAENLISALRCLYDRAVDDGLIDEKDNPARKVPKPRRLPSTRRALDRHPAGGDQPGRRHHGRRPGTRHADRAAAHRDRLPSRRRARAPSPGPGPRAVPDPAPGEGRDVPLAADP